MALLVWVGLFFFFSNHLMDCFSDDKGHISSTHSCVPGFRHVVGAR